MAIEERKTKMGNLRIERKGSHISFIHSPEGGSLVEHVIGLEEKRFGGGYRVRLNTMRLADEAMPGRRADVENDKINSLAEILISLRKQPIKGISNDAVVGALKKEYDRAKARFNKRSRPSLIRRIFGNRAS